MNRLAMNHGRREVKRTYRHSLGLLLAAVLCYACADRTPSVITAPSAIPGEPRVSNSASGTEGRFRLTAEQRAQVREGFDVDALERLLAHIPVEHRTSIFSLFVKYRPGQPVPLPVEMATPQLQELLDEVWAPRWRGYTIAELEEEERKARQGATVLPGRATAMRRLREGRQP